MCFIENKIGSFRRIVGIAKARRAVGGDFVFGKILPIGPNAWGYNQVDYNREDCTFKALNFPSFSLVRITGVSLSYNAGENDIGKGIYFSDPSVDGNPYMNESVNQIEPSNPIYPPELFLANDAGDRVVDLDLPILSTGTENNLNLFYDTSANQSVRLFGRGKVVGVPELIGLRSLLVYVGVSFEIISDENSAKIRKGCL